MTRVSPEASARDMIYARLSADADQFLTIAARLQYEPNLVKELSRKQKQNLEKLVPMMNGPQGRLIPIDVLIGALARAARQGLVDAELMVELFPPQRADLLTFYLPA